MMLLIVMTLELLELMEFLELLELQEVQERLCWVVNGFAGWALVVLAGSQGFWRHLVHIAVAVAVLLLSMWCFFCHQVS